MENETAGKNKFTLVIAGLIIVIAIIVVSFAFSTSFGTHSGSTTLKPTSYSSTMISTFITTSIVYQPNPNISTPTCGPSNSCIGMNDVISLIGGGGVYNSSYVHGAELKNQLNGSQSIFVNNVTGAYEVSYSIIGPQQNTSYNGSTYLSESLFTSPHAKSLYVAGLKNFNETYEVSNATLNGMTYSYAVAHSVTSNSTVVVFWKDNATGLVLVLGRNINPMELANTVSMDIP